MTQKKDGTRKVKEPEPRFAAPGVINIGTLKPGEVLVLQAETILKAHDLANLATRLRAEASRANVEIVLLPHGVKKVEG